MFSFHFSLDYRLSFSDFILMFLTVLRYTGIIILFYIPLLNLGSVGTGIMSTELLSFHPIYGGLHVVGPQQICLE